MRFSMGHSTMRAGLSALGQRWLLVILAVGVLTVLFTVTAYADQPNINKIDVKDAGDVLQITVSSNSSLAVHGGRVGDRFLFFDLYGKLAVSQQKRVDINSGGIKSVKCVWYQDKPAVARVSVGISGAKQYSISADKAKKVTTIKIEKRAGALQQAKAVPQVKAAPVVEKPVPGGAEALVPAAASAPMAVAQVKAPRLVSLDFVASDIHDVLKALAIQGGVNIVASPDVKGDITVSLNKVTVEEALKLVASLSGYRYQMVDGAYVVGTADNIKSMIAGSSAPEEKITDVTTIIYADPTAVAKQLEGQFPGMTVTNSAPTGKDVKGPVVLVMTGPSSLVQAAKAVAEAVEQSFAQSTQGSVTDIYEVKYADITELAPLVSAAVPGLQCVVGPGQGFNLQCPTAVAMGAGSATSAAGGSSPLDAQKAPAKLLIMNGSQAQIDKAKGLLAKMDVPQAQIVIEAKVVDLTDTGAKELGIEWGDQQTGLTSTGFTEQRLPADVRDEDTFDVINPADAAEKILRFGRSAISIPATIRALVESGKAKVLANPNVMALDGKPASAFVGDEVKYVVAIQPSQNGITVSTETARVGVQLHTISRVSSDGYITMDLHPEVSVITRWVMTPADLALPEVSRRYVDSTVRVKDGETIVIGGLIKDEEIESMGGVPLLKDLPFIGNLFKSRSTSKSHSEVMMFITPRVITQN